MTFPAAPLDRFTRLMSFAVVVFVALVTGLLAATIPDTGPSLAAILFGVGLLVLSFGYAPAAFETAPGELRVHRRMFGSRSFALEGAAGRVSWRVGLASIRLVGSGGLWGWFGLFWRSDVGTYHAYITDRSRLVACETANGRAVVVSPADPDAFVRALEAVQA